MNTYIKTTYERHDGDISAIRQQLIDDYRDRVPCAVDIVDMFADRIFAMPYTDGAQYIYLQYNYDYLGNE